MAYVSPIENDKHRHNRTVAALPIIKKMTDGKSVAKITCDRMQPEQMSRLLTTHSMAKVGS